MAQFLLQSSLQNFVVEHGKSSAAHGGVWSRWHVKFFGAVLSGATGTESRLLSKK